MDRPKRGKNVKAVLGRHAPSIIKTRTAEEEVSHNIHPSPSQMNDLAQSKAQSNGGAREGTPGEIHSWSSLKAKKSGCMSDVSMALCIVGLWAGSSHRNKKEAQLTQ